MNAKRLNILGYVQELLLRRYEALRDGSATDGGRDGRREAGRDRRPR